MKIRLLGKESLGGDSPTLYATDQDSYLIQGWTVTDPQVLAKLAVPEHETCVEIYSRLLTHLSADGLPGTVARRINPVVHVLDDGNLIVQGKRVSDVEVRRLLAMPNNEDCVEVSKTELAALMQKDEKYGADNPGAA